MNHLGSPLQPLIDLLNTFNNEGAKFRPTEIYNEGWLLKILLHEYSKHSEIESPLRFYPGADWYSESMLPTRFKARYQGDEQAESRTNADGVIGHIKVGEKGKADLELDDDAKQLTVVEAKMNSPLSKGTTKAPDFDQAARNVACMVEVLTCNDEVLNKPVLCKDKMEHLSFVVIAPKDQIDSGKFSEFMNEDNIKEKVKNRAYSYKNSVVDKTNHEQYIEWYENCFAPVIDSIHTEKLSWESAISKLPNSERINAFYQKCKEYN